MRRPESASNSREEQLGNPVVSRALQSKTQLRKSQSEEQTLLTIIRICFPRLRDSVTAPSTLATFCGLAHYCAYAGYTETEVCGLKRLLLCQREAGSGSKSLRLPWGIALDACKPIGYCFAEGSFLLEWTL